MFFLEDRQCQLPSLRTSKWKDKICFAFASMVPFLEDRKCQVPSCLDYYYMFGLLLHPGITTSSLDYDSISGLLVHLWITTSSFNYRFIFIFYLWINTPSLDYIYILGLPLYVWIIAIPLDNKSCRVPQFVLFWKAFMRHSSFILLRSENSGFLGSITRLSFFLFGWNFIC